jgi:hypothetical protein
VSADAIERYQPIRLETAVKIAFPDGSVTVSALRKQIKCGRLIAWEIAGKHLTSLNEIERMVEKCRVTPNLPGSGIESQGGQPGRERQRRVSGSSSTADASRARDAAKATARALRGRSPSSLPQATSSRADAAE